MKLLNGGKCSEKMIHPSYSIDLVWHCHMLHPAEYEKDMKKYVGMYVSTLGTLVEHSSGEGRVLSVTIEALPHTVTQDASA